MRLAGIDLTPSAVAELAIRLREDCYVEAAEKLERAITDGALEVRLLQRERDACLDVLIDARGADLPELAHMRSLLLSDYKAHAQHPARTGRTLGHVPVR